jgi:hypothetical protein
MILIGSRATAIRNPDLLAKQPVDFDFVCTQYEYASWMERNSHKINITKTYFLPEFNKHIVEGDTNLEFEIITPGSSNELLNNIVVNSTDTIETQFGLIPNLNTLFTIKSSHKFKKFNNSAAGFYKTALDYHMMKNAGATITPELIDFHALRQKETLNYKHPSLAQSKDNFFKDEAISYVYDHDTIHEAVKIGEHPAYTYYLKDNEEVSCDMKKFFACSEHIRMCGVLEETMVLALERSQIPFKDLWSPEQSFNFALAKVCTSITSGRFREYSFQNVFNALKLYPKYCKDYLDKFNSALHNNRIKPFTFQEQESSAAILSGE